MKIPLSKDVSALVDEEDYETVASQKWYFTPRKNIVGYAIRIKCRKPVYMHRLILNAPIGKLVDHINGDGLDNRRCNLRLCGNGENVIHRIHYTPHGRSKYIGVELKPNGRWSAYYYVDDSHVRLGVYSNEEDAARIRDHAVVARYGEFATLNFPIGGQ